MSPLFGRSGKDSSKPKTRRQKVLTCPHCQGHDLYYENAMITGIKYHCKDCDYVGAFIIEQEVELDQEGNLVNVIETPEELP